MDTDIDIETRRKRGKGSHKPTQQELLPTILFPLPSESLWRTIRSGGEETSAWFFHYETFALAKD